MTPDFVFDIFMARRSSSDGPFRARVKLHPLINSEGHDYGPALTPDGHTMFSASGSDNPLHRRINHLYVSERQNDRAPWGPRIYPDTLNCPTCFGGLPTIRAGGKEICGWAIAATASVTRTFTVRYAIDALRRISIDRRVGLRHRHAASSRARIECGVVSEWPELRTLSWATCRRGLAG